MTESARCDRHGISWLANDYRCMACRAENAERELLAKDQEIVELMEANGAFAIHTRAATARGYIMEQKIVQLERECTEQAELHQRSWELAIKEINKNGEFVKRAVEAEARAEYLQSQLTAAQELLRDVYKAAVNAVGDDLLPPALMNRIFAAQSGKKTEVDDGQSIGGSRTP